MYESSKKLKSKKAVHNQNIRQLRKEGKLPQFDGTYIKPPVKYLINQKTTSLETILANYKKQNMKAQKERWSEEAREQEKRIKLSDNGSILNNKYSYFRKR